MRVCRKISCVSWWSFQCSFFGRRARRADYMYDRIVFCKFSKTFLNLDRTRTTCVTRTFPPPIRYMGTQIRTHMHASTNICSLPRTPACTAHCARRMHRTHALSERRMIVRATTRFRICTHDLGSTSEKCITDSQCICLHLMYAFSQPRVTQQ